MLTAWDAGVRQTRSEGHGPAGPCALTIFGATGDLSKRLLIPSLYNLASRGLLPEHFAIIGFALRK